MTVGTQEYIAAPIDRVTGPFSERASQIARPNGLSMCAGKTNRDTYMAEAALCDEPATNGSLLEAGTWSL